VRWLFKKLQTDVCAVVSVTEGKGADKTRGSVTWVANKGEEGYDIERAEQLVLDELRETTV